MALAVEYEPALVEASALIAIRGHARERAFHQQRDPLYEVADPEARDRAFVALHGRWFRELGLAEPLLFSMIQRPPLPTLGPHSALDRLT